MLINTELGLVVFSTLEEVFCIAPIITDVIFVTQPLRRAVWEIMLYITMYSDKIV